MFGEGGNRGNMYKQKKDELTKGDNDISVNIYSITGWKVGAWFIFHKTFLGFHSNTALQRFRINKIVGWPPVTSPMGLMTSHTKAQFLWLRPSSPWLGELLAHPKKSTRWHVGAAEVTCLGFRSGKKLCKLQPQVIRMILTAGSLLFVLITFEIWVYSPQTVKTP